MSSGEYMSRMLSDELASQTTNDENRSSINHMIENDSGVGVVGRAVREYVKNEYQQSPPPDDDDDNGLYRQVNAVAQSNVSLVVFDETDEVIDCDKVELKNEYESMKELFNAERPNGDRKWNDEYQELFDRVSSTPQGLRERAEAMSELRDSFRRHYSVMAAAIVMSRVCDGLYEPLVTPRSIGGRAGGEKFVVGQVLYKFARDWEGIYGGDDEEAMKAAKLELKATNALINSNVRLLHSTLVGLYSSRGYCVFAIALAPLARIEYGSKDAGEHVSDASNSPLIASVMKEVAFKFHLRTHGVRESSTGIVKQLCHPVDVECHSGDDNRLYMLDLAREAPPTPSTSNTSWLTCHFRFELLHEARGAGLPSLSSDALSNFSLVDDLEQDERDIDVVFSFLLNDVIPKLSSHLDEMLPPLLEVADGGVVDVDLSCVFHKYGVNMRYLPSVATRCRVSSVRVYLCEEMHIRTVKILIRKLWNNSMRCSKWLLLERTKSLLCELLDWQSLCWSWPRSLVWKMHNKYSCVPEDLTLLKPDLDSVRSLDNNNSNNGGVLLVRLLKALCIEYDSSLPLSNKREFDGHRVSWRMVGDVSTVKSPEFVALSDRERQLNDEIELRKACGLSFVSPLRQLLELYRVWSEEAARISRENGVRVCNEILSIVESSTESVEMGWVLRDVGSFLEHFDIFDRARVVYEDSLRMFRRFPNDRSGQRGVGVVLRDLGDVCRAQSEFDDALRFLDESVDILTTLYTSNSTEVANCFNNMAIVFRQQSKFDKALEYYERSLPIDTSLLGENSTSVAMTLSNMANVFYQQSKFDKALEYYERSLAIKTSLLGENSTSVAITLSNMANVFYQQSKFDKALEYYERSLAIDTSLLGENSTSVAMTLYNMALLYNDQGSMEQAVGTMVKAKRIFMSLLPPNHPDVQDAENLLQKWQS